MPAEREHSPEDRVKIKNIIETNGKDVATFWRTVYRKEGVKDLNGGVSVRETASEQEFEWDFAKGFFFSWGNEYYVIRPGEEKVYPRFLAEHAVDHMVQYMLNKEYQATRRSLESGLVAYDNNILNNEAKKKAYRNRIIVGVEEYRGASNDSFEQILAKEFGGNFDEVAEPQINKEDVLITKDEVEQWTPPVPQKPKDVIPPTDNPELKAMREEADINDVEYTASDSAAIIKSKILKAMA
jgi:hypothetical protein